MPRAVTGMEKSGHPNRVRQRHTVRQTHGEAERHTETEICTVMKNPRKL